MSRQQITYLILGITILFLVIGLSMTNRWIEKQMKDISADTQTAPSTAHLTTIDPPVNTSNPSLDLIGTPLDPLAPVPKKTVTKALKKLPVPEPQDSSHPLNRAILVQ